ncbi:MAG: DUF2070 family protein [Euryarchaeota archaeon]|nr:DUF2070 family protein [Euryarchaeota archaeon]
MTSITRKHINSGRSLSSVITRLQKMNRGIYIIGLIIVSFILIFLKTKDIYTSLKYSVGFIGLLTFSIILESLVVRETVVKKFSLFYGLLSLFSLSYSLTLFYSLYIIRLVNFSKILSVWIPYSILMSMLVIYYTSFSLDNIIAVGLLRSVIIIGIFFHDIDFMIFGLSTCVLAVPNVIIASNMESKILSVKTKDIAKAYFSTFSKSFEYLENLQEIIGEDKSVITDIFMFKNRKGQIFWIVNNYFHYGPFGGLGSSEVPKMLLNALKNVIVLKGPATHRENISTARRAKKIVKRIVNSAMHVRTRPLVGRYHVLKRDKFKVYCIDVLGHYMCFVDILAEGYDDIPQEILGNLSDLENVCVIDLHTSRGSHGRIYDFTKKDFEVLVSLINDVIKEVNKKEYVEVEISYCKYVPKEGFDDIYSGGIHALLLKVGSKKILLLNFDGNNMALDLKRDLQKYLRAQGYEPIISTTDSHEKATPLGDYYMVGDLTRFESLREILDKMLMTLEKNLSSAVFGYRRIRYKTRILGDSWLSLLHHSLKTSKRVFILVLLQVILIMAMIGISSLV